MVLKHLGSNLNEFFAYRIFASAKAHKNMTVNMQTIVIGPSNYANYCQPIATAQQAIHVLTH